MRKRIVLLNLLFVLDPKLSTVQYHGAMALHAWNAKVSTLQGEASIGDGGLSSAHGKLTIEVKSIDTGVISRNEGMFKILEAEKYPQMIFNLKDAGEIPNRTEDGRVIEDLADGEMKCVLHGDLVVRGRTSLIEGKGKCRNLGEKGWEVEGDAPVDMRTFGIEPPRLAIFTMDPIVGVTYKLVFRPKSSVVTVKKGVAAP